LGIAFQKFNETIDIESYSQKHVCTRTILWLFIAHEFFERGYTSQWYPYLRALPRSFDVPFFWTSDELKWIAGTNLEYVVAEKRSELQKDFLAAQSILLTTFPALWKNKETLTFENFIWARTVCSSRAFPSDLNMVKQGRTKEEKESLLRDDAHQELKKVNGKYPPCKCHLALWPLFDMLNHRRGQSMIWDGSKDNGIWFISGSSMPAGEEVWNSYGPKGNDVRLFDWIFNVMALAMVISKLIFNDWHAGTSFILRILLGH
jgi:hypothetical protein